MGAHVSGAIGVGHGERARIAGCDRSQLRLEMRRVEARSLRTVDVELHLGDGAGLVIARHPTQGQAVGGGDAGKAGRRRRREAVVEQRELREVRRQDVDAVRADEVAVVSAGRQAP